MGDSSSYDRQVAHGSPQRLRLICYCQASRLLDLYSRENILYRMDIPAAARTGVWRVVVALIDRWHRISLRQQLAASKRESDVIHQGHHQFLHGRTCCCLKPSMGGSSSCDTQVAQDSPQTMLSGNIKWAFGYIKDIGDIFNCIVIIAPAAARSGVWRVVVATVMIQK